MAGRPETGISIKMKYSAGQPKKIVFRTLQERLVALLLVFHGLHDHLIILPVLFLAVYIYLRRVFSLQIFQWGIDRETMAERVQYGMSAPLALFDSFDPEINIPSIRFSCNYISISYFIHKNTSNISTLFLRYDMLEITILCQISFYIIYWN
jgi:hypothetical protein